MRAARDEDIVRASFAHGDRTAPQRSVVDVCPRLVSRAARLSLIIVVRMLALHASTVSRAAVCRRILLPTSGTKRFAALP